MEQPIKYRIPGIIITVLVTIASFLFMCLLVQTRLIPTKYLAIVGGMMLVLVLCVYLVTRNSNQLFFFILGAIATLVIILLYAMGTNYIIKGMDTLESITETTVEIADVGVYVKADDPATNINSATGYRFGILDVLDRENTDKTVAELSSALGTDLTVISYAGLAELVDSILVTGETDAIIMNSAFLSLLTDMEGYENTAAKLCEIHVEQVETVIEHVVNKQPTLNDPEETTTETDSGYHVFTMYISGIDSLSGLIAKSRSDVNIIATVNTETRQMLLVSTPRDYYVPLPISDGIPDKLTHAGIYGIDVSIGTLAMLYETDIDYYFRVNFSGFEQIIDALDGITVVSDYSFSSQGHYYVAGENNLYGSAALAFCRERSAFAAGDRQRGKNQMAVIKGIMNKALSPALLNNYTGIMESVAGSFETSVPYDVLADMVRTQLDEGGSWNIVSYSVDGSGASKKPYSLSTNAYVMVPNYDTVNTAIELMNRVKNGEIISAP